MAQINAEFGRGNNLNSYRGTQWYTAAGGSGTFPTGAISFSDFYGKQLASPAFSFTISSNVDQANLRTLAVNAGWNGTAPVVATLAAGYWIYSSSAGVAALTIDGSFPGGVTFINNQYVVGMGGNGGNGAPAITAGAGGGTALAVSTAVTIYNYSYIAGGGGGGGGGANAVGAYLASFAGGGGGGGGGTGLGTSLGGAGGAGTAVGAAGSNNYANSSGAAGGAGGVYTTYLGGAGGAGGGWGSPGATGGTSSTANTGAAGGAAGNATSGNGFITWAVTGNRLGPLG
jgi:hypothetical protein